MKKTLLTVAPPLTGGILLFSLMSAGPVDPLTYEATVHDVAGTVHFGGEQLGQPTALQISGDALLVLDRRSDRSVHVLDAASGSLRGSAGSRGEGPGEFMAAWSIDRAPDDEADRIWVFDADTQRLTQIDLGRLERGEPWAQRFVSLRGSAPAINPVWTAAGELLASGFFTDGRFGVFDRDGRQVAMRGALPQWPRAVPPDVLQHAFQARIESDPPGRRFAVGSRHAGRLEIFDALGRWVANADVPFEFDPVFSTEKRDDKVVMGSGKDLRFGYIDVATTERRIFGLFSGRKRGDYPGRANFARDVHVFDWNGRLEGVIRLDQDAIAITVDSNERRLFAARHDPAPAILRYELPGELEMETKLASVPGNSGR